MTFVFRAYLTAQVALFLGLSVGLAYGEEEASPPSHRIVVTDEALAIHRSALVIDGHNDLPWTIREKGGSFDKVDISQRQADMHTDIPRLLEGGIGAQFWSVFVPASTMKTESSLSTTLEQIELVRRMVERYPDRFEIALTTDDIRRIHAQGKIASMFGVEGGHSIENSINVLRQLYREGVRYMTLTHSVSLDWADSCTGDVCCHGLSKFGEEIVREMNRLGMLVDISHVTPECMKDAIHVSRAPVIFSHSSARAIADHPRNVPDDVLRLTAKNGGVVMVNYYTGFVDPAGAVRSNEAMAYREVAEKKYPDDEQQVRAEMKKWYVEHPADNCHAHVVLDHIEHIIKVAGIDHVGLGSDYDGVPMVPVQLDDVSSYPVITQGLMDRGYNKEEIHKVLGENVMRAFATAEKVSRQMKKRAAEKKSARVGPLTPVAEDPALPRVLVLGDSISIGYTLALRNELAGKANLQRAPSNCGPTSRGLRDLDRWLGDKPWDVIHFNFGLHDLKHIAESAAKIVEVGSAGSHRQVPPQEYEANLRELVRRLQKTDARLIWCSTTPVPAGAIGRIPEDVVRYNEIARRVMEEQDTTINDLYTMVLPELAKTQMSRNVHFTPKGSRRLAELLAPKILPALEKSK